MWADETYLAKCPRSTKQDTEQARWTSRKALGLTAVQLTALKYILLNYYERRRTYDMGVRFQPNFCSVFSAFSAPINILLLGSRRL
jgi:hypothetical protein